MVTAHIDSPNGRVDIPSGTVTFLFTDIEGSTKLAQKYPQDWETMRGRHDALLHQAIKTHHGYVFQIIGDAFCVAFHTVTDALNAALTAQRLLHHELGPTAPMRVRMGISTGAAQAGPVDAIAGGYTGYVTLARVQHVMSAAHGGQILLSNSSAELVRGELPDGITLRDMGEHRLKGMINPERLWQVVAPDLPQEFPPLPTLDEIPNNLPVQLTSFIGREKQVEQIVKRLEQNRLVTLTGSGGVGKTRLSIRVASQLLPDFPNGVWFVELAPITDPALVTQTVCAALKVTPQANMPALSILTDYLKSKKILLVIDNCEHLVDACAALCKTLLQVCPHLRIIASSREALCIDGEYAYRVPSLSLPNSDDGLPSIQKSEAVQLFLERATAVLPEFEMTETTAPVIAQICQRLDGIALALELAASRVKMLTVEQIASRLDDAFRLLTGGSRTAVPRQQTLRALIDWSYNLLSDEERAALRRLSVFMGGWTLEAAESVLANPNMLDLLTHLVDKSLVMVDYQHGSEVRYYLFETIRQYAREKLAESGEENSIRDRHLAYFLDLAQRAEPEVRGAQQAAWFDKLEMELDNVRAALGWSLASGEQGAELGLQMASSLWWFWFLHHSEEGHWLEKALNATSNSPDQVTRANALSRLAWVRFFGQAPADQGLKLGQTLGPAGKESVALALLGKGAWAIYQADYAGAKALLEASLKTYREIGDRWGICETQTWLGMALTNLGDHPQAIAHLEESLSLAQQARDANEIGFALWILGTALFGRGDCAQATPLLIESQAIYKKLKSKAGITFVLRDLVDQALAQGDFPQAVSFAKELLSIYWDWGGEVHIAEGLEKLSKVAVMHQHPEYAARLLGAAEALRQSIDAPRFPYQTAGYEQTVQSLRPQLAEGAFTTLWAEGGAMNAKQAVEYALGENP